MSRDQNTAYVGYIGDEFLPSYIYIYIETIISQYMHPYQPSSISECHWWALLTLLMCFFGVLGSLGDFMIHLHDFPQGLRLVFWRNIPDIERDFISTLHEWIRYFNPWKVNTPCLLNVMELCVCIKKFYGCFKTPLEHTHQGNLYQLLAIFKGIPFIVG